MRVCLGAGALGTLEEGAATIRLDEAIGPGVHQQSIGDTHPFERALTAWRHQGLVRVGVKGSGSGSGSGSGDAIRASVTPTNSAASPNRTPNPN